MPSEITILITLCVALLFAKAASFAREDILSFWDDLWYDLWYFRVEFLHRIKIAWLYCTWVWYHLWYLRVEFLYRVKMIWLKCTWAWDDMWLDLCFNLWDFRQELLHRIKMTWLDWTWALDDLWFDLRYNLWDLREGFLDHINDCTWMWYDLWDLGEEFFHRIRMAWLDYAWIWKDVLYWLSRPQISAAIFAWWTTFTLVCTIIVYFHSGRFGAVAGTATAAFQSFVYGVFTPAVGIFATMASMVILGRLSRAAVIFSALIATIVAATVWENGLGEKWVFLLPV